MKEILAIIAAYNALNTNTTKAALATVVRVEGSSYRRTGARMLIMDNGQWVGGISGGCLEGDALKRARLAIAQGKPTLVTYDTTEDDDYQIGVGLGCNGVIDVLISPLHPDHPNPLDCLKTCLADARKTHVLLTLTSFTGSFDTLQRGDMIRYEDPDSLLVLGDAELTAPIDQKIQQYISKGKSAPFTFELVNGQSVELFIEVLLPVPHLILMGQQYDILPLVRMTNELGWMATVVANPQKVTQTLFAEAHAIVAPDAFASIPVDQQTAVILMAHDFKTDKNNLPRALATDAPFVGMLGPRVRAERIFNELTEEGRFDGETDRIHAPIGLDIGAATPEEIALSIVAEVRAFLAHRSGTALRHRPAPIHEREDS
ncbi:XdhC family protein [Spirosoma rhododendri]|uniref:XdhC family protein n=1 Tax=Spirosoma rhododendri TaxID=2728024 RepID=A0A7L5DLR6_9BACT|nr:XdhC family protein [Spirosoma rhododendri]QJD79065.1 XdhC family protein [Spirosoma rhododendri]